MNCTICQAPPIPLDGTCVFCHAPIQDEDDPVELLDYLAERIPIAKVKRAHRNRGPITEVTVEGETSEDVDIMTIRNGKTVRMDVHGDTALLERVYGKKALTAG